MSRKLKYLVRSILNIGQEKKCPNCGGTNLLKIDQKFLVTSLFKCEECMLQHRHPKDTAKWLEQYYQEDYEIDTHMMTDLPSDSELHDLITSNFEELRDYSPYFETLFPKGKASIIDYGCSWGYNVFKLAKNGYKTSGFELSKPRANFGKNKLNINIFSEDKLLPENQDVFMSSHVIEHLIDLPKFIEISQEKLSKDGYFIAFCPNGNEEYRQREPEIWHGSWGDIHVNLIDSDYAKKAFKNNPYLVLSGDWSHSLEEIKNWDKKSQVVGDKLDGKELLIIARPNLNFER